jgi:integrase
MGRPITAKVEETKRKDGTTYYWTRVMVDGERTTVSLGDERDGDTRHAVDGKVRDLIEDIRLGRWEPDLPEQSGPWAVEREPGFADLGEQFLKFKRSQQLRENTIKNLEWAIRGHLTPYFKRKRPSKVRQAHVIAFSDHEIAQRGRIAALRERGKYLLGPNDGAMRELSDRSINNILAVLTELLAWAAQRGWGDPADNPASGWRLKVKPRLTAALERDELFDLILAAGTPRPRQRQAAAVAARADLIVRLRDDDRLPWKAVAELAGVAEPTAIYHYQQRKDLARFKGDEARAAADKAFVAALAYTGARVTELCDLDLGDVDLRHAKFRIAASKTEAGVREVDLTPYLVEVVADYFESRGPLMRTAPAFPDGNGKRRNRHQANKQTIAPAVRLANEWRVERGEQPLPHVTPHTLRHTYITLAFEANFPLPYVMEQVGHDDSRTTTDIYAKVSRRRNRAPQGAAFDRLVSEGAEGSATPHRAGPALVAA